MSIALRITKRFTTHESPFMVKDTNGITVFYAKYEHEAIAFIRGVQYANSKQAERSLWTVYEERFDVFVVGDGFQVMDFAKRETVGEVFSTEEEAWDEVESLIQEDKEQDRYMNNSGR